MEALAQLHPLLVHFPIAFFVLYFIFETFGIILNKEYLIKSALIILALGVVGSVEAVLTGNQAEELLKIQGLLSPEIKELTEEHESWATITLWYYFFVLGLRIFITTNKKYVDKVKYIFIILSLIGVFLIYKTGEYGGKLVYDHGAGTKILNQNTR
ncbi:MAG: DUF2231 domain-containing protein [Bacteroidota bacterium]